MTGASGRTVAIVGAGVAGLATARALMQKGFSCTIFDRASRVGGVWADGYDGYGVQVQRDLYAFPDFPLPPGSADFTSGAEFQAYLERFVDAYGLRDCLRLGARVASVSQGAGGDWSLIIEGGDAAGEQRADVLVIATGLYSETPHIPDLPGRDGFQGRTLHSSEVRDINDLSGQRVVVVGYGKSAADIAQGAVSVADSVRLVFRTAHWPVPRKLLGVLPFKWGMLTRLTASLIPPYVRSTPAVRLLHSIGRPLPWLFWRVVELLLRFQQRLGTRIENGQTLVPDCDVLTDAYMEKTMVPRPGLITAIRRGDIRAHRSGITGFTRDGLQLGDGTQIDADTIVFGTGWRNAYRFLSEPLKAALGSESDGTYLYRHILHPALPNLAFAGRVSSFMSVTTYALQARWLAGVLSGEVSLPSSDTMASEIDELKRWKRSWMPEGPARSGTLLLHMAQYHDELVRDLGQDPLRKRGILAPLKEVLAPYVASDYREIV